MFNIRKITKTVLQSDTARPLKVRRIDPNKQPLEKDMVEVNFNPAKVGRPKPKPKVEGLPLGLPLVSETEPEYHKQIMRQFKIREWRRMNPPVPKQQSRRKKVVPVKTTNQLKGFFGVGS